MGRGMGAASSVSSLPSWTRPSPKTVDTKNILPRRCCQKVLPRRLEKPPWSPPGPPLGPPAHLFDSGSDWPVVPLMQRDAATFQLKGALCRNQLALGTRLASQSPNQVDFLEGAPPPFGGFWASAGPVRFLLGATLGPLGCSDCLWWAPRAVSGKFRLEAPKFDGNGNWKARVARCW